MKTQSYSKNQGSGGLLVVAVIGLLVAGGTFLATFITTQRAKTPDPRVNLRIPVPSIPPRKPLDSLPIIIQPSPEITIIAPPETTGSALQTNESTSSAIEEIPAF